MNRPKSNIALENFCFDLLPEKKSTNSRLLPLKISGNSTDNTKENLNPSNYLKIKPNAYSCRKTSSLLIQVPNLCMPPVHPFKLSKKASLKSHRRYVTYDFNLQQSQKKVSYINYLPIENNNSCIKSDIRTKRSKTSIRTNEYIEKLKNKKIIEVENNKGKTVGKNEGDYSDNDKSFLDKEMKNFEILKRNSKFENETLEDESPEKNFSLQPRLHC